MFIKIATAIISSVLVSSSLILVSTLNVAYFKTNPTDFQLLLICVLHIFGVFLLGGIPSSILIDRITKRMREADMYQSLIKLTSVSLHCLFGLLVISIYLIVIIQVDPDKEEYLHPTMAFIIAPIASYTFYQINLILSYMFRNMKERKKIEEMKELYRKIRKTF